MTLQFIMMYHYTKFGYNTAIQYFYWSLWLMMICNQPKSGGKRIISTETLVETVIFWLSISPHCELDLKDSNPFFSLHNTLSHMHCNTNFWFQKVEHFRRHLLDKARHRDRQTHRHSDSSRGYQNVQTFSTVHVTKVIGLKCCCWGGHNVSSKRISLR